MGNCVVDYNIPMVTFMSYAWRIDRASRQINPDVSAIDYIQGPEYRSGSVSLRISVPDDYDDYPSDQDPLLSVLQEDERLWSGDPLFAIWSSKGDEAILSGVYDGEKRSASFATKGPVATRHYTIVPYDCIVALDLDSAVNARDYMVLRKHFLFLVAYSKTLACGLL